MGKTAALGADLRSGLPTRATQEPRKLAAGRDPRRDCRAGRAVREGGPARPKAPGVPHTPAARITSGDDRQQGRLIGCHRHI